MIQPMIPLVNGWTIPLILFFLGFLISFISVKEYLNLLCICVRVGESTRHLKKRGGGRNILYNYRTSCCNTGTIVICYLLFREGEGTQAAVEPGLRGFQDSVPRRVPGRCQGTVPIDA
jgi:hypothetical protein